jgi:hypothetical protein
VVIALGVAAVEVDRALKPIITERCNVGESLPSDTIGAA